MPDLMVKVEHVSMQFSLSSEKVDSLKESLKENTVVLADLKSMIQTLINYMRDEDV